MDELSNTQTDFSLEPVDFSLEVRMMEERRLLEMGVIPAITMDNLIAFAYMQPDVKAANILVSGLTEETADKPISFTFQIQVRKPLRYRLAMWGLRKQTLLGKLVFVLMAYLGAPIGIGRVIETGAKRYLQDKFVIKAEIHTGSFPKNT